MCKYSTFFVYDNGIITSDSIEMSQAYMRPFVSDYESKGLSLLASAHHYVMRPAEG